MGSDEDASSFDAQVASVALLGEPVRRALYRYVVAQPGMVSREEAARQVGVAHHVAKFHLDKLEAEGLLAVEYRRPPGRGGPGAGRPTKLYRRTGRDIAVSLPARRYDLPARVMAEAITLTSATGAPVSQTLRDAARRIGRALGRQAREARAADGGRRTTIDAITPVLEANGYEPRTHDGTVTLANCPFHSLSRDYTELVCGMNLDLIEGLIDAAEPGARRAALAPAPDRCCVTIAR